MAADAVFVDTNVLVYANRTASVHHARAVERLHTLGASAALFVSRQVLREYLAAVTRSSAGTAAVPMSEALGEVERMGQLFEVVEDGPAVMGELVRLLTRFPTGGRQVYDANIVATMLTHEIGRLLTFNTADFRRFSPHITIEPL